MISSKKEKNEMIRVFIGFDSKEVVAFNVLSHSINRKSSIPVAISPVALNQLSNVFTRERNSLQSTEFSFSRFLVPYLCNYEGWALFMDCDMLVLDDLADLWKLRDENYSLMVVKHNYTPRSEKKFLGHTQTTYEKKNWSSLMLFNNSKCTSLTPEYVNAATGLELHQFKWLADDNQIGELSNQWNFLVDEDIKREGEPSILHYTNGGPYFEDFRNCGFSEEWFEELKFSLSCNNKFINLP
ncbi:glycosyltransferase [Sphingobacterium kitahiroshimense]|uniref:Glycosyltransferase n=1 Tax=Sphingobacterium kitahiroshimense TaxID=470446 RepID=A0ABV0BM41_9SPHI